MPKLANYDTRLVRLKRSLATADALNESVESWSEFGEFWAAADYTAADEALTSGLHQSGRVVRFEVNGRPELSETDRLRVKATGDVYQITGIRKPPFSNATIVDAALWTGG